MRLILIICAFLCAAPARSQTTIRGAVKDTADKRNLQHTVVSVLRKTDSVLISFTRAGADGLFEIKNIRPGSYLLIISYPKFVDYTDTFTLAPGQQLDMGDIAMTPRARMLEMAVVRQKIAAIRWKGDTLVFKADSFKVKDDATVEDLLKKFPGFQVDRTGKITAGGEKVEKVLVDGEEFFGDDPTIATRNLDAKAVDEVELFDKKSDQAAFTGIDDGQKTKTLNLKLKADRKKGYFGKLQLGSNGREQWDNSVMMNGFVGKRKISGFGIMSHTGKTGLDWSEAMNYGSTGSMEMGMSEDGGQFFSFDGGDAGDLSGGGSAQGIPKSWSGGINYSNKWNNDRVSLNGSYRYGRINTPANNSSRTQYLLPDTSYFINSNGRNFNINTNQKANATSELKIDSFTTLKLTFAGNMGDFERSQVTSKESLNEKREFVNQNSRKLNDRGDNSSMNGTALLMHRFRKPRRTVSVNLTLNNSEQQSEGFLYALTDFYDAAGIINRRDTLDQKRVNNSGSTTFTSNISYTEPLGKTSQLQVNYGFNRSSSNNRRNSFDKVGGKYESLNNNNSADFESGSHMHTTGLFYSAKTKKMFFNLGNNFQFTTQDRTDRVRNTASSFSFVNINPNFNFGYNISKTERLNLYYNGNTSQPTPDQLNPVQDNTDPLYVVIGNENLKPSFRSNMSLYYNKFVPEKDKYMSLSVNYNSTINNILAKENFDVLGRRISQFVNVKSGNYSMGANVNYYSRFSKLSPWSYDVDASVRTGKNTNFINGLSNTGTSNRYRMGASINFSRDEKYSFSINGQAAYTQGSSSIGADIPDFWTYGASADFSVDLPAKMKLQSDFTYNFRQKTSANDNANEVAYWTAELSKKFGKKGSYRLGLSVNDILNQNLGFNRSVTANGITENTYDTFRRYWMLRFVWSFSRNGKPVEW